MLRYAIKIYINKHAQSWDLRVDFFKTVVFMKTRFTEARSEGLIELKLVRKPPKVSRGRGGGARGRAVPRSPDFLGALSYNQQFGGSFTSPFSGGQNWAPRGIQFENRRLPEVIFGPILKLFIFPRSPAPRCSDLHGAIGLLDTGAVLRWMASQCKEALRT